MSEPEKYSYLFSNYRLSVDGEKLSLYSDGWLVPLSTTQLRTLLRLLMEPGELISKDELMTFVRVAPNADPNVIEKAIHDLRVSLHDAVGESRLIKTERGRGYRLSGDVRIVPGEVLPVALPDTTAPPHSQPAPDEASSHVDADVDAPQELPPAQPEAGSADAASVEDENAADAMITFEGWMQGPGKKITGVLLVCVLAVCAVSIPLSLRGTPWAKLFATTAQLAVVLILYVHFRSMSVSKEFLPVNAAAEGDFVKLIGCGTLQECHTEMEITVRALIKYKGYWRGLLMSWLGLYLCLSVMDYTGINFDRLGEIADIDRRNLGIALSISNSLFNNWNTLMIFLCFYVLNKQIRSEEDGRDSPGNFLGGLIFLVIATAIQVSLLLPIDRAEVPNVASLFSGLAGGIAMALYVGRLQSKFINPRIWLLIALYSYTAIQPLFLYLAGDKTKAVILADVALLLKCLLYLYIAWLLQSGRLLFYLVRVRSAYKTVNTEWQAFRKLLKKDDGERGPQGAGR
jgi:DNA-binding winged helix-turn-helix (wHTH) protein